MELAVNLEESENQNKQLAQSQNRSSKQVRTIFLSMMLILSPRDIKQDRCMSVLPSLLNRKGVWQFSQIEKSSLPWINDDCCNRDSCSVQYTYVVRRRAGGVQESVRACVCVCVWLHLDARYVACKRHRCLRRTRDHDAEIQGRQ